MSLSYQNLNSPNQNITSPVHTLNQPILSPNTDPNSLDAELQEILSDQRFIFGNFGGLVKKPYIKYCNLVALEIICIIIFAIIYFPLLLKYDIYLLKADNITQNIYFFMAWRAILHSINYQSTANYTPINFDHIIVQSIITLQLSISLLLVFLFLTV
jgi:hypothetical protein